VNLADLLHDAVGRGASDVHVRSGARPFARVRGDLTPLSVGVLDEDEVRSLVRAALSGDLPADGALDADFAFTAPGIGRFRGNAYRSMGGSGLVLRHVREQIPDLVALGIPAAVIDFSRAAHGLVLIAGPTGSGKSTTLAGLVGEINARRPCHILTIEDPVEFIHHDLRASVTQREVGTDTESFERALRSGLRQDPDVIVVGEIRDAATMRIVLQAAETGHLVLASLHAGSAGDALQRVVNLFEAEEQPTIRATLAESLVGIACQLLVTADATGERHLVTEVLANTPRVRDAITSLDRGEELEEILAEGGFYGMHTMMQDAVRLVVEGTLGQEDAHRVVARPTELDVALHRVGYRRSHV
jgi:twitching motility protein PilT